MSDQAQAESGAGPSPAMFDGGRKISPEEFKQILSRAAESPAIAPEEFESWGDWKITGVMVLVATFFEVICLLLFNTDLFTRLAAASADGFGKHFPMGAVASILIAVVSGALCAYGLFARVRWLRALTELRLSLGTGQIIVYLLLAELIISEQPARLVPFVLLLGAMITGFVFLSRTRQAFYQG